MSRRKSSVCLCMPISLEEIVCVFTPHVGNTHPMSHEGNCVYVCDFMFHAGNYGHSFLFISYVGNRVCVRVFISDVEKCVCVCVHIPYGQ